MAPAIPALAAGSGAIGGGISIGTILSAAGSAFSAFSAFQDASFQAKLAEQQAEQARVNANAKIVEGSITAQDKDFQALQLLDEELATQGASGFKIGSPSFARKRSFSRRLAQLDRERIQAGFKVEAQNLQQQANQFTIQGALASNRARSSIFSGVLGVGTSLITGATSVQGSTARRIQRNRIGLSTTGFSTLGRI